ncbi:hypothetical protein K2Y11_21470 [bacterium]|nr:hypothetical protein [bacterium]
MLPDPPGGIAGQVTMRGAWIIVLGLAPILLSGCVMGRSLARKERLPDSSLGAGKMTAGPVGVDSVLRNDTNFTELDTTSLAGNTPIPTAVANPSRNKVEQAGARDESLTDEVTNPNPRQVAEKRIPGAAPNDPSVHQVSAKVKQASNSSERMRAIAHQLKQSSPERLDEFMKEVRQGAAQGNMDSVLSSWEVSLEFIDDAAVSPAEARRSMKPVADDAVSQAIDTRAEPATAVSSRSNSLSAALKKNTSHETITDPSTRRANLPLEPERQARVMSVAASVPSDDGEAEKAPPSLEQPLAPSPGLRRLPYRPEEPANTKSRERRSESANHSRQSSSQDVDFASWAEYAEEQAGDKTGDPARWKVYGRLLHAMAGNTNRALEPIDGLDQAERRFWRGYVYALDRYFDDSIKKPENRVTEAAVALSESIDALSEKADLSITEPIFCRAVHSFGNYDEFDQASFHAGDGVVVYWECKNFTSVESADGYRTKMKAEFEILDSFGNRRHQFEQKFKDDVCRGRRHDYFNVVVFEWPRDLPPGDYTLKVTVTDLSSDKVTERMRRFQVVR